jgi:histidinol-phosphate aminotransferase
MCLRSALACNALAGVAMRSGPGAGALWEFEPAVEDSAQAGKPHPGREWVDLSANENPFGPSPRALAAMVGAARHMHRYPDKEGTALKRALAEHLGAEAEQLLLGNGSGELIAAIARATLRPGDEAIIGVPSFPAYRSSIARAGAATIAVPLLAGAEDLVGIADSVTDRTRLVIVANPNNPTGGAFGAAPWQSFIERMPPQAVVVVDEAYYEYVADAEFPRSLEQVAAGRNVIVLRSFSKAYGLAGLRIGYGVAPVPLRKRIEAQLQNFNTSRVAQAAAVAALHDAEHLACCVEQNREGRDYLHRELNAMGFKVHPSQANFLLVRVPNASEVHRQFRTHGVLVKLMDRFGVPDAIRVTVGRMEENERFLEALASITASGAQIQKAAMRA